MENKETKQEEVKVERVCGYTVWENTDGSIDVEGKIKLEIILRTWNLGIKLRK